jgi:eukaryotic-like serine/threonine-protein kinase
MNNDARLTGLISVWQDQVKMGKAIPVSVLCKECPELQPELERRIAAIQKVGRLVEQMNEETTSYADSEQDSAQASSLADSLPRIPGYEVLALLGKGGMGIVYKARQQGTEQTVALKLLRPDKLAAMDAESRERAVKQFLTEARAAACLRHPNRVRILHLGEHAGQPFYAMELIEGGNLADKLSQPGGLSKEAAIRYLASVAEALQEAHQARIIHRDIKPHNILIDSRTDGTDEALLADFGLAKMAQPSLLGPAGGKENSGQLAVLAGTLSYMSPEQTQDSDRVTEASDVYSLGATLYELLTGRPPFQGKSPLELFRKIREEKPEPLRKLRRDVSPRIERICLKCLQKEPEWRYRSAQELAQLLRRYLQQVRFARHFTTGSILFMAWSPTALLTNLAVYFLLQIDFYEPVIWLVVFSMYLPLFAAFHLAPKKDSSQEHSLSRLEMTVIWGGKMCAAIGISIALRMVFVTEPATAVLLAYPVFAALTGLALFATCRRMPHWQWMLATGFCLLPILMAFQLSWAPILYGIYSMVTAFFYGFFMRRLGMELS